MSQGINYSQCLPKELQNIVTEYLKTPVPKLKSTFSMKLYDMSTQPPKKILKPLNFNVDLKIVNFGLCEYQIFQSVKEIIVLDCINDLLNNDFFTDELKTKSKIMFLPSYNKEKDVHFVYLNNNNKIYNYSKTTAIKEFTQLYYKIVKQILEIYFSSKN